jgi:transposase
MQRVTAVEDGELGRAAAQWLACVLCDRMAQTTTRWFPAVHMGDLGSSVSCLRRQINVWTSRLKRKQRWIIVE